MSMVKMEIAVFVVAACLCYVLYRLTSGSKIPTPPSIGSFADEKGHRWEIYAKRSRILGSSLLSTSSVGPATVILNTREAIFDLLEKRKSCASRPRWPMAELLGRQNNVGFTYYGKRLKEFRKVLHKSLNARSIAESWEALLHNHSLELCNALYMRPEHLQEVVEENIQQFIAIFTYGDRHNAEHLRLAQKVVEQTGEALQPARWMVNRFPALMWVPRWMPGASFQAWAHEAKCSFLKLTQIPFYTVKADMLSGKKGTSFVYNSLESLAHDHSSEEEDIIMFSAGSLLSAGTDTMTSFYLIFIGAIVNEPSIQDRAYQEILNVVGRDELPCLHHREALSFIDCIVKEIHRCYPVVPLISRSNQDEEIYEGVRIPKNSWLMANVWAALHDERTYHDPSRFIPERFEENRNTPDPRELVYGVGRRRCPGAHLADLYLFLIVARVLALYKIMPLDPSHPPHLEFAASFALLPKPFRCKFAPREYASQILAQGGM